MAETPLSSPNQSSFCEDLGKHHLKLTADSQEVKKMCNVLEAALILCFNLLFFPSVRWVWDSWCPAPQ